jgi:hypothetical protein
VLNFEYEVREERLFLTPAGKVMRLIFQPGILHREHPMIDVKQQGPIEP